jgi:spermidine/putrescine transport system permease protein
MMKSTFTRISRQLTLFFRRPKVEKIVKVFAAILKNGFFFLMMFLLYMPIIVIAIQSLNDSMNVNRFEGWTLRWYIEMFEDAELMVAISNTLVTAFLSTLIATVFGTMFAIGIHSLNKKARSRMVFLNQIPILNADVVTGLSLMLIFKVLMNVFPDIFVPFPANALFFRVSVTVLLAHVYFSLPYVVLSVLPKLSEIDPNLYDAALDLGSKPFDAVMRVIVPAIKAGIFTGMLMAFTMSIDDFVITFFTSGGNFDNVSMFVYGKVGKLMTPSVYAYNTFLTLSVVVVLVIAYVQSARKQKKLLLAHSNGK